MKIVDEIAEAVRKLSRDDLSEFRRWFEEFDADAWDREIEEDATTGRLDNMAKAARRDLRAGRTTPLTPRRRR